MGWTAFAEEMYSINDSKLLDFVPDYRVQLIQPMTLSEDDFEKFHTSLREVLQTIKYSVDAQKLTEYITQNERMHRLDLSAANVINTVAGIGLEIRQDRGKVDMCKAIEDLKAESREEGRAEGREEGHTKGREETIEQTVAMLRNMKIPKETILSELQKTFQLAKRKPTEYITPNEQMIDSPVIWRWKASSLNILKKDLLFRFQCYIINKCLSKRLTQNIVSCILQDI